MLFRRGFLVFLLLIAALPFPASCLDPNYAITQYMRDAWQTDQGLPQNTVFAVVQTRDGYLWLATQGGVVRFDGVRFVTFDARNQPEIKSDWIDALLADRQGTLWIGSYGGGLSSFQNGKFKNYTSRNGISQKVIYSLTQAADNSIWIGTEHGLSHLKDGRFSTYTTKDGLLDDHVRAVLIDRKGNLWIGTEGGLNSFRDGKFTSYSEGDGAPHDGIMSLMEDHTSTIWIGTRQRGISTFVNGRFSSYSVQQGLTDVSIQTLLEDRNGNVWIGTRHAGLNRFNKGKFSSYQRANGLLDNTVFSLAEDREGSLWVGTESGLTRLREAKFLTYTNEEGLSSNDVRTIFEDHEKNLWIGTRGGGLNRFQNGKFTLYTTKHGLSSDDIWALHEDNNHALWMSSDERGVSVLKNGVFKNYSSKDGLINDNVGAIESDRNNRIWIGTYGGVSVFQNGVFTNYTTKDGLPDNEVRVFCPDPEGGMWIGTRHGLCHFENGKFTIPTIQEGRIDDLVLCLYLEHDGTLWIGTRGGGLSRLKNGRLTTFTTREGLFSDIVFELLDDDRGNFWMSCNRGIFRVNKTQLNDFADGKISRITSNSYGKADGMKNVECNGGTQPTGWKTRDGSLWFPTLGGVVMVNPRRIRVNTLSPPVKIEQVIADDHLITNYVEPQSPVILEPGKERFQFRYAALSYLAPEKIHFQYKLEGFDKDWVNADTQRTAFYTHIPPGRYLFHVKACNSDGIWNEAGAAFPFVLKPHFYQTIWFYLLCAFSLIVMGWNLNRYRLQRLLELERVRARIAADLHDDIGSGLTQISILSEVVRQKSIDSGQTEMLMKIAVTSRELLDSMADIVWAINPNRDRMTDLVQRIRRVASDLLTARQIELRFSLSGLEADPKLSPDVRRDVYLIFKECVNNVTRHSDCTTADISLAVQAGFFVMKIADNGKGYSDSELRHGHGLENMHERAKKLGGAFTITSKIGEGTFASLKIPLR